MDIFLKPLTELIQPPWNYFLGLGFLILLATPRFVEFRRQYLDEKMGRRHLELEKLKLEVLKLRLDLEAKGVHPEPPETRLELQAIPAAPPPAPAPVIPTAAEVAPKRRGRIRDWLIRHPRFARPFMLLCQIIAGFYFVVTAMTAVIVPFLGWTDPDMEPGISVSVAVLYGALAWVGYKGYAASRSVRAELNAR